MLFRSRRRGRARRPARASAPRRASSRRTDGDRLRGAASSSCHDARSRCRTRCTVRPRSASRSPPPTLPPCSTQTRSPASWHRAGPESDTAAQGWLSSLEGPAHGVAQPALWILLALVGIALIKKIPYHIFALTHRLVPAVFLVLVFHSLVLAKPGYWAQPVGWIFGLVSLIGSIAALIALFRQIGARRKVGATVVSLGRPTA